MIGAFCVSEAIGGFSETGRVKEAQKLGAGQYVKKPYTLGKIGLAVKTELAREYRGNLEK